VGCLMIIYWHSNSNRLHATMLPNKGAGGRAQSCWVLLGGTRTRPGWSCVWAFVGGVLLLLASRRGSVPFLAFKFKSSHSQMHFNQFELLIPIYVGNATPQGLKYSKQITYSYVKRRPNTFVDGKVAVQFWGRNQLLREERGGSRFGVVVIHFRPSKLETRSLISSTKELIVLLH
jgi:hypothetical protein